MYDLGGVGMLLCKHTFHAWTASDIFKILKKER